MQTAGHAISPSRPLVAIQCEIRRLVDANPRLREAMPRAFDEFAKLVERHEQYQARRTQLLRKVLATGRLNVRDTAAKATLRCHLRGLCDPKLAAEIKKFGTKPLPKALEARGAKAALAALNESCEKEIVRRGNSQKGTGGKRGRLKDDSVQFVWTVVMPHPEDLVLAFDPCSNDPFDLSCFAQDDRLVIAMYRLGGLHDLGSTAPVVPKPRPTGDSASKVAAACLWHGRLPATTPDPDGGPPLPSASSFPVQVATEMLSLIRGWLMPVACHSAGVAITDMGPDFSDDRRAAAYVAYAAAGGQSVDGMLQDLEVSQLGDTPDAKALRRHALGVPVNQHRVAVLARQIRGCALKPLESNTGGAIEAGGHIAECLRYGAFDAGPFAHWRVPLDEASFLLGGGHEAQFSVFARAVALATENNGSLYHLSDVPPDSRTPLLFFDLIACALESEAERLLALEADARRSWRRETWSQSELLEQAGITDETFKLICDRAGLARGTRGRGRTFSRSEVGKLIDAADTVAGKIKWVAAARAWRELLAKN